MTSSGIIIGVIICLSPLLAAALVVPPSAITRLRPSGPGFAVLPDALEPSAVRLLKKDVETLRGEKRFAMAGIGDTEMNRIDDSVRQCSQCFLFPRIKHGHGGHAGGRTLLYDAVDAIRKSLQEGTGVPLDALLTEGLYAAYPNGGFYRRHIDSYPNTPQASRRFSYLLYLNDNWQESDGGCLRIHTDGGVEMAPIGAQPSFVDVEPRGGTLVLFRSDVPHEVLDTSSPRLAVAGWFNAPPTASSARRMVIAALGGTLVVGGAIKSVLAGLGGGGARQAGSEQ